VRGGVDVAFHQLDGTYIDEAGKEWIAIVMAIATRNLDGDA
jgi:hypothetical protein